MELGRDVEHYTCTVSAILWRPITKSLGGGLYYMSSLFQSLESLSHVLYLSVFIVIESMFSVRPPSSGLAWGTLPGVMFRLRRGRKVGCGIVIIPHCCLCTFTLKGLLFSCIVREKESWCYSMVKTPWIQLYGLSCRYEYP